MNQGLLDSITPADWNLIRPYLKENERLFGISLEEDLLTVDGRLLEPAKVYRKVRAIKSAILAGSEQVSVPE